mgnify:CR=1 FL=1
MRAIKLVTNTIDIPFEDEKGKVLFTLHFDRTDENKKRLMKSFEDLDEKMSSSRNILAKDRFDQPLFLFENEFAMRWFADKYPNVELKSLL